MKTTLEILRNAKGAAGRLATLDTATKNAALLKMADDLETHAAEILQANAVDLENAKNRLFFGTRQRP